MSKRSRTELIEEFKSIHDQYLETLSLYESPRSRKPLIEESMTKFQDYMSKSETMPEEEIRKAIDAIKECNEAKKYQRGLCSIECLRAAIKAQDLCVGRAMKSSLPHEAVIAIVEMTSMMLSECIQAVISQANSEDKPWEIREKSHDLLSSGIDGLTQIADVIKAGRVLTLKLPTADPTKYKQFLN